MMKDTHRATWDTYTQSWSVGDVQRRLQLFGESLEPSCVYTDPLAHAAGFEALSSYMAVQQQQVPGVYFVTTDFKAHNRQSLAHWDMLDGAGNLLTRGASHACYAANGRLMSMTGFFNPPVPV